MVQYEGEGMLSPKLIEFIVPLYTCLNNKAPFRKDNFSFVFRTMLKWFQIYYTNWLLWFSSLCCKCCTLRAFSPPLHPSLLPPWLAFLDCMSNLGSFSELLGGWWCRVFFSAPPLCCLSSCQEGGPVGLEIYFETNRL